ncbi:MULTISPECIES: hypothetical protein, partial [Pseudomonadota]
MDHARAWGDCREQVAFLQCEKLSQTEAQGKAPLLIYRYNAGIDGSERRIACLHAERIIDLCIRRQRTGYSVSVRARGVIFGGDLGAAG